MHSVGSQKTLILYGPLEWADTANYPLELNGFLGMLVSIRLYHFSRTFARGGASGTRAVRNQKLPWYKKPIVSNAFYTDLQRGSWHIGFYTLVKLSSSNMDQISALFSFIFVHTSFQERLQFKCH